MSLPRHITDTAGLGGNRCFLALCLAIGLQPLAYAATAVESSSNAPAAVISPTNFTPTSLLLAPETNSEIPTSGTLVENFSTRLAMARYLEKTGLQEKKLEAKQAKRTSCHPESQRVPAQEIVRHAAQITCQFIRLVRHCLFEKTSWRLALPLFKLRLESYL